MASDIRHLIPLPDGDLDQLSMLMVNPATAHLLPSDFVKLEAGDWVIQSAANSAVGCYAVQRTKARDINLVCVVRRESAIDDLKAVEVKTILVDGPILPKRCVRPPGPR